MGPGMPGPRDKEEVVIRAKLTLKEARMGMKALEPQIARYADLLVRKGVNVKPGQEVAVRCPVERADFCRVLVERAYAAGAGHVTVLWDDDTISRLTYENVETAWFETTPAWQRAQLDGLAEAGACFIFVEGADPEALRGIDPAKPAAAAKARNTQCRAYRHSLDFNVNPWCIAGAPVAAWAPRWRPGRATCSRAWRTRSPCTACGARSYPLPEPMGTTRRALGSCTTPPSRRTCAS